MKTSLAFLSLLAGANAFVPVAPMVSSRAVASAATSAVEHVPMRMGLNPELAANFPRDFAKVSVCWRASFPAGPDCEYTFRCAVVCTLPGLLHLHMNTLYACAAAVG